MNKLLCNVQFSCIRLSWLTIQAHFCIKTLELKKEFADLRVTAFSSTSTVYKFEDIFEVGYA